MWGEVQHRDNVVKNALQVIFGVQPKDKVIRDMKDLHWAPNSEALIWVPTSSFREYVAMCQFKHC